MAAPWEKYASPEAPPSSEPEGPWSKYGAPAAATAETAPPPEKTLREKYKDQIRAGKYEDGSYMPSTAMRQQNEFLNPFGINDEMRGAGGYLRGLVTSGFDTKAASKAYTEETERARAEEEVSREERRNNLGWGGNLAADLVGGFATMNPGTAVSAIARAPNFLGRVVQSAKTAAPFGVASGIGHAEGGIGNRLEGGLWGGLEAAALGPALSEVAIPGIRALAQSATNAPSSVGNALRNIVPGTRENIDQRLLQKLRQQDQTPADALKEYETGQQAAQFGKTQTPLPETVADSGPAMQRLAYAVKASPGPGSTQAEQFLNTRARGNPETGEPGTFGRVNEFLRRSLQVTNDNYAATEAKLLAEQKALSDQAYGKARANPNRINVDDVLEASRTGDIDRAQPMQAAMDEARKLFAGDVNLAPSVYGDKVKARTEDLSLSRFDSAKQALDDKIQVAINRGRNNEARELTQLKNDLIKRADEVVPEYKDARDIYGDRAQLLEALENGRKFAGGDSEALGTQYKDMSTGEKRMFRIGMARQTQKDLGNKVTGANLASYFDKPNMTDALSEIMTKPKFKQFQELLDREGKMAGTRQRVLGNSATAERQQDMLDFSLMTRLGRQLKSGNIFGAAGDAIATGLQHLYSYRQQDARLLARELFNPDPAAVRATLNRLSAVYGRGKTAGAVNYAVEQAKKAAGNTQIPWMVNALSDRENRSNQLSQGKPR